MATDLCRTARFEVVSAGTRYDRQRRCGAAWAACVELASKEIEMDRVQMTETGWLRSWLFIAWFSLLFVPLLLACGGGEGDTLDPFASQAPSADFEQDVVNGQPGLQVQFSSTSIGEIDTHQWEFGGGSGDESSSAPQVTFGDVGSYTIRLTVSGPLGSSSVEREALIQVGEAVSAGFSCEGDDPEAAPCQNLIGYAPFTGSFNDASLNADTWSWDFGDGATSSEASPSHTFTEPGTYSVAQTVSGPGGTDAANPVTVQVGRLDLTTEAVSGGAAPQTVTFAAATGGLPVSSFFWTVQRTDGLDPTPESLAGSGSEVSIPLLRSGNYLISVAAFDAETGLNAIQQLAFEVGCGEAMPALERTPVGGTGPLAVAFEDQSSGFIERWEWDFGDGERCIYPDPNPEADPDYVGPPACESASPAHTYDEIGSFDVALQLTGAGAGCATGSVASAISVPDAVRVYMLDASFEEQTAGGDLSAPWSQRPEFFPLVGEVGTQTVASGSDQGMPTNGLQWAVLDGADTLGNEEVEVVDNSISQDFILPATETVLEFDLAFLYREPPASGSRDRVTAEVSDGTTTVQIPSAEIDTTAAYAGQSSLAQSVGGAPVWITPPRTASLDVAAAFGLTPPVGPPVGGQRYTLTIRVGNAADALRGPEAYVDHVRFVEPKAEPVNADFELPNGLIVAGQPVQFEDASCVGPLAPGCEKATSWTWDFGTSSLPSPPESAASNLEDPVYVFDEAGVRTVRLTARSANQEGTVSTDVTVVSAPEALWGITSPASGPYTAPATLTFADLSTPDPNDPIVSWDWDFSGWGDGGPSFSTGNPAPVSFLQVGLWPVRLTIQTASGQEDSFEQVVSIE